MRIANFKMKIEKAGKKVQVLDLLSGCGAKSFR